MPKISLHVEADSIEEYLEVLYALYPGDSSPKHRDNWAGEAKSDDAAPLSEVKVTEMTAEETAEAVAEEDAAQPVEEKKARKPRGPNKPKMTPVTEEAPEEVEHVGTVAVAEEPVANGADEVLTRMDLGDTIAGYVRKYGINFAQTDVSKMLQDMFGADVRKKSDVPDDQPSLRKAISAITQATIDNPYNRKVDVNG